MIKKYPRTNSGYMRRTSRIYLTHSNAGKVTALRMFLMLYVQVVNYFIEYFWSMKNFTPWLADKYMTSKAVNRFKVTARLAQCAAKQAKEIVRSQKERKIKRMPLLRRKVATLDSRFVEIEIYNNGNKFAYALILKSGLPKITILLNATEHLTHLCTKGWEIGKSIRIGIDNRGVWVELILEKAPPPLRQDGKIIGIDRAFRKAFVTSEFTLRQDRQ